MHYKSQKEINKILSQKFGDNRVNRVLRHFISCILRFEDSNWEDSLIRAGKFIESVIKLLWIFFGKSLPRSRDFKASEYAKKIIKEIRKSDFPEDNIRLQIPRASIFVYDVTSNRGARHDPEDVDPNEMDAIVVLSICSWILSELIRYSAKNTISINEAKMLVDSLMERKYPIFEEIDGRVYVDNGAFKGASDRALLILYRLYPRRIDKATFNYLLNINKIKETAIKFSRLKQYLDIDQNGKILLRSTGRKKAEKVLKRHEY